MGLDPAYDLLGRKLGDNVGVNMVNTGLFYRLAIFLMSGQVVDKLLLLGPADCSGTNEAIDSGSQRPKRVGLYRLA